MAMHPTRVLFAASRSVRAPWAIKGLIEVILKAENIIVLLRGQRSGRSGQFESGLARACRVFQVPVVWYVPEEGGRGRVFDRDIKMVSEADLVICIVDPTGSPGGTEHIIEKAQDKRVPVYAYTLDNGKLARHGEHDPDNAWSDRVPRG
jgi:hypothetical protein